ncbi:MAG: hypothetical protein ACRBN8_21625 [Nannocystales bacterium]
MLRDRVAGIAGLSYVPLLPTALGVVAMGVMLRAHAVRRRLRLVLGGVLCAALFLLESVGTDRSPTFTGPSFTLLHQNVLWGGSDKSDSWISMARRYRPTTPTSWLSASVPAVRR